MHLYLKAFFNLIRIVFAVLNPIQLRTLFCLLLERERCEQKITEIWHDPAQAVYLEDERRNKTLSLESEISTLTAEVNILLNI